MEANYENILLKLSKASGISSEELDRRVEAKKAKLSGLITKEGAAQIIASELGINFDNEKLKINELLPGMRKANVLGKVIQIFPIREFERNGNKNKVCNFVLADDTSNIKVVLWDTNHIDLIENKSIKEGSFIELYNGSVRDNEVHLGSFSQLKLSEDSIENVVEEKVVRMKNIVDLKQGENTKVRAFIVQAFMPKFFEVNPSTGKKFSEEDKNSGIIPEKRALLNIVLDDGTETIRAVLFNESIKKLNINPEDFDPEVFMGKEFVFSGNVRLNNFFNNLEFGVNDIESINVDELIESLNK